MLPLDNVAELAGRHVGEATTKLSDELVGELGLEDELNAAKEIEGELMGRSVPANKRSIGSDIGEPGECKTLRKKENSLEEEVKIVKV